MRIGFFDSGIGGITVLHEALKEIPGEDYLYYADTDNAPYGTRTRGEVADLVTNAVDFIIRQRVKAVVVACNTATSVAIEILRNRYSIPILGMEPAIKPAVEKNGKFHRRVLVTGTPLTLKEEKCRNLIERVDNEHIVDLLPLPELVRFAENYEFGEKTVFSYLEREFGKYDLSLYGTVVLGCTHFPFFRKMFRRILPDHVDIIDGNSGTVRNLKRTLELNGITGSGCGDVEYFVSGRVVDDRVTLERYSSLHDMLDRECESGGSR